jgi:hypothetical protein
VAIVVDYAWGRPSIAALRAAGATGVSRYLSRVTPSTVGKIITAQEYQQLLAAGLAVVLNWEYDARDYRGGAMAGANHAREAIAQAQALGYPRGCAIIGSADTDVTRADWLAPGRPYYQAFSTGLRIAGYRPGIYGPWDVLEWAREDGVADVFWQAGMSWAWSGGRNRNVWPGVHLYQRRQQTIGSADCDVSDIIQANYGQTGAGVIDMDQAEQLIHPTPNAPGRTVGAVFTDQGNLRDWLIGAGQLVPGDPSWPHPDSVLGKLAAFLDARPAAPVALTDAQVTALGAQVGAHLDARLDQLVQLLAAAAKAGADVLNPPT